MADVQLSTLGSVIKTAYEGEADTNAFTDAEKAKLAFLDSTSDADKPISDATQAALDLKAAKSLTINTLTADYTLVLGDAGEVIEVNSATGKNMTIPNNSSVAFPIGTTILFTQYGVGKITLVPDSGVTIRTPETLISAKQYAEVTIYKRGTNEWIAAGNLEAA